MKKVSLCLFCLCTAVVCLAQVSVSATLGTTGPTSYLTLKSAFDAVNSGTHSGAVTITVSGTTSETVSAVLNASGSGSASYTGISIKPGGGSGSSVTGNIAGPLIDLNGADNVTIDGLNSSGNSLTLSNAGTANAADVCTIRYINDATANTIQNTSILGSGTNATSGTVYISTTVNATGNDNNTIAGCNITDGPAGTPVHAIYSLGSAAGGQENSGMTIFNNNISNFFNADLSTTGVAVLAGNTDWTITGNRFFQTLPRTFTTGVPQRVIQVTSGNNYKITGNTIGYASASATGTYTLAGAVITRFLAIDLAVGTSIVTSVQNNTLTNFSFQTSNNSSSASGIWCAINILSGDVNVGTETGNTIGSGTGTGAITIQPTVAGTLTVPITSSSTGTIRISNNAIGSIDVLPSGAFSGNLTGIQTQGASGNITISNNFIGNPTANNMRIGALGTTTGNGIIRGIINSNMGTVLVTSNTIRNLTHNSNNALALFRAIECQQGTANISSNVISNVTANGVASGAALPEGAGILFTSTANNNASKIELNTISNLNVINTSTTGTAVIGIYLGADVDGVSVLKNRIFALANASTSVSSTAPAIVAGIYMRSAFFADPITLANNMISLGNGQATNTSFLGIWNASSGVTGFPLKLYYNSVNVEGIASAGGQPSFCYYRGDFSTTSLTGPTVDIKNNIFTNKRTGGTGKHYAIANGYGATTSSGSGWAAGASDYNVLNAGEATVGYWSGDQTFAGWQTASSGDVHSLSGVTIDYISSASDLHLNPSSNGSVDGRAIFIASVTTDIDNDVRSSTAPDLGADEFTAGPLSIGVEYLRGKNQGSFNVLNWKAGCTSNSVKFSIERSSDTRTFTGIGNLQATQARCAQPFDFSDNNPGAGINYYRLKMTEIDGKVFYSSIIAIINKDNGVEVLALMPTIVQASNARVNVSSAGNTRIDIFITDLNGRILQKQTSAVSSGSNNIDLNLGRLPSGAYQLTAITPEGLNKTIRFFKQ